MRIGTALRALDEVHPPLARHLRLAVSTGRFWPLPGAARALDGAGKLTSSHRDWRRQG